MACNTLHRRRFGCVHDAHVLVLHRTETEYAHHCTYPMSVQDGHEVHRVVFFDTLLQTLGHKHRYVSRIAAQQQVHVGILHALINHALLHLLGANGEPLGLGDLAHVGLGRHLLGVDIRLREGAFDEGGARTLVLRVGDMESVGLRGVDHHRSGRRASERLHTVESKQPCVKKG